MKSWRKQVVVMALVAATGLAVGVVGVERLWAGDETGTETPMGTTPSATDMIKAVTHFKEAKKLFDVGKYPEALVENEAALLLNPQLTEAKLLKLRLATRVTAASGVNGATTQGSTELLSLEQVWRIRLAEINSDRELRGRAKDVRGSVPRKALLEFWEEVVRQDQDGKLLTNRDRDNFINPTNFAEQVRIIKEKDLTGKYLAQIKLESDPAVFKAFKLKVQPFLLQNCATSDCHGGAANTTDFRMYGAVGNINDLQTYTNFYLMSNYTKNGFYMIDRQAPERSLFIQYSMAQGAHVSHPGQGALKQKIADTDDPRYKDMVEVISMLKIPRPGYGFVWTQPKKAVTTSTAPAATMPTTGAGAATGRAK